MTWSAPAFAATQHNARQPGCLSSCIQIVDYQSETSPLHFSRTLTVQTGTQIALTPHWRHDYDIRLTRDGDDRVVFDSQGQAHHFQRQDDGSYLATDTASGSLEIIEGVAAWTDTTGIQTEFQGSFPTRMQFSDGQTLSLNYHHSRLHSITDDNGDQIVIEQDDSLQSRVLLPDGQVSVMSADACREDTVPDDVTDEPERCDTQANPVPGFDQIPTPAGVTTLDARPASCQSYFVEYYGTLRGEEIETGIAPLSPYADMLPSNRSYPIVDFINGDELIVVRSRDLASPSFNDPDSPEALYQRLLRDGAQIQSGFLEPLQRDGVVTRTEQGRTTHIVQNPAQHLSLHVLIRQDMASPQHWRQIEQARTELLARYGIRLQVVIIP